MKCGTTFYRSVKMLLGGCLSRMVVRGAALSKMPLVQHDARGRLCFLVFCLLRIGIHVVRADHMQTMLVMCIIIGLSRSTVYILMFCMLLYASSKGLRRDGLVLKSVVLRS